MFATVSFSHLPWDWFFFILIIAISAMGLWAFHFWWKKDHYTRERFAFSGFAGLVSFGIFYVSMLVLDNSIWGTVFSLLLKPFGVDVPVASPPLSPIEAVLISGIYAALIAVYWHTFKHWKGQKSHAHYEQEQKNERVALLHDIALMLSLDKDKRKKLLPYEPDEVIDKAILEKPESLAWHERARQLWLLKHRSYCFDNEYDPAYQIWLGTEKNTGALALLLCQHQLPSLSDLKRLKGYAHKIAHKQQTDIDIIVALKNNDEWAKEMLDDSIQYTCEALLLQDLVNFDDYFADIRYRAEQAPLVDSQLTLNDTYTPSHYRLEKNGENQAHSLEAYVQTWLSDHRQQQLAVLGEYGQGKSTASLLLSKHMIERYQANSKQRIPILIELRGKNLRSLVPEELLASWALHYDINVKALLQLQMAGRLLLIFEGFDEIDLSGDTEQRVQHFATLWKLNYPHAKILITGRPNFFLDSQELTRALGTKEQTQTVYLAPFDLAQIEHSLRAIEPTTREEILALAVKDDKFLEVVARPSLLYLVSLIWRDQLSTYNNINSALVIDLFIRKSLQRQQEKHRERPFMILNSAERHYFMLGIAAYMGKHNLPNQIKPHALQQAVYALIDAIPEEVSKAVNSVDQEIGLPLRSERRLEWSTKREEILKKIQTDVRSCGLLVTDLSKDGYFKFAHKSYMELLQAQVFSQLFSEDALKRLSSESICNSWRLDMDSLLEADETISFLAELLKVHFRSNNDNALAKRFWGIFVSCQFQNKLAVSCFFRDKFSVLTSRISGRFVEYFGLEKGKAIAASLYFCILIAPGAVAVAVSGAVSGAFAVAVSVSVSVAFAFAFAFAFAVAIAKSLVDNSGWLWSEALLLTLPIGFFAACLGILIATSITFLRFQQSSSVNLSFQRIHLWFRICKETHLTEPAMEKIVGKGMLTLLAQAEQWCKQQRGKKRKH